MSTYVMGASAPRQVLETVIAEPFYINNGSSMPFVAGATQELGVLKTNQRIDTYKDFLKLFIHEEHHTPVAVALYAAEEGGIGRLLRTHIISEGEPLGVEHTLVNDYRPHYIATTQRTGKMNFAERLTVSHVNVLLPDAYEDTETRKSIREVTPVGLWTPRSGRKQEYVYAAVGRSPEKLRTVYASLVVSHVLQLPEYVDAVV